MKTVMVLGTAAAAAIWPIVSIASEPRTSLLTPDPTDIPAAIVCLPIFFLSYLFVMTEERTKLRKSKPVILGAG